MSDPVKPFCKGEPCPLPLGERLSASRFVITGRAFVYESHRSIWFVPKIGVFVPPG